jgi:phosphate starvation-inducible PhoH-like protein
MAIKHKSVSDLTKKRVKLNVESNLDFSLNIQSRSDLTDTQKQIIEAAQDKQVKCILLDGVAGTSKSWTTILSSLILLNSHLVKEIVYLRSLVQSKDGQTGYLKGDLDEKTFYYNEALNQTLSEIISQNDIKRLHSTNKIKCYPTSMLRSYNFHDSAVIAEECQTMTFDSLFTIATRLGPYSKLFMIGDTVYQNDLGKSSGFKQFVDIFCKDEDSYDAGFRCFKLDSSQIVRSPFVKFVVQKVENYQKDNKQVLIN